MHLDGVSYDNTFTSVALVDDQRPLRVGRGEDAPGTLAGVVEEIAVYAYALPKDRIVLHRTLGKNQ
jgi:hypothetical protein